MASYSTYSKLGRVKLPNNNTYALIDKDGRAMLASDYDTSASYSIGDHVIYQDDLWRCKAPTTGAWDSTKWELTTVDAELKNLAAEVTGGIHYRGKTSTALYDGCTTNPITISGNSYTAETGDLVILDLSSVAVTYAVSTAYSAHQYLVNSGKYYITNAAITAGENTSFAAISEKVDLITSDPKFLFDGTSWSSMGSISDGLGDLAYKDTATGNYTAPTGSGSVTVTTYAADTRKLTTTTVTGTNGTVSATYITSVPTSSFAVAGNAVVYGTADVGTAVSVGTSLTGTTTFVTSAIASASLTGTTTFNTDAIKDASLSGTTTFATGGVTASVDGDMIVFSTAGTGTVTISTTPATTSSVGLSTTATGASEMGTVGLGTSSIYPATSADTTRTLTPVGGTATGVTGVTYTNCNPASAATTATTVATGGLETGSDVMIGLTTGTSSLTVSVGTTTDTVVVK